MHDDASAERLRQRLRRRAIRMEVGGFRPSDDPLASWIGRVNVAAPGETWPTTNGKPMLPLCQLNIATLPFRPPRLDDVALITVFIGPDTLPVDTRNGDGWCLRAYRDVSALVPLARPDAPQVIKPFPLRPTAVDDEPSPDDMGGLVPEELFDEIGDLENVPGHKLGGWPSLVQSEIWWAPNNEHPARPEYVFQIDSDEKAGWHWGYSGVGHFGRGTTPATRDEWVLAWQSA